MTPADDQVDAWLRREGLPWLVPPTRRGRQLLPRTAPMVALLLAYALIDALSEPVFSPLLDRLDGPLGGWVLALTSVLFLVTLGVPALVAWWTRRHLMTRGPSRTRPLAVGLMAAYLVTAGGAVTFAPDGAHLATIGRAIALLLLVHAFVWVGAAAVFGWALRTALRNVGAVQHMASRALPVLLTLVVFAFYSTEMWQVTDSMTAATLWWTTLVMAGVAVLAVWPAARSEVSTAAREVTPEAAKSLLAGTPLHGLDCTAVGKATLTGLQGANILLVLIVAQLLQAAVFVLLFGTFLFLLGRLTVTDALVHTWLGHDRIAYRFVDSALPIDHNTLRTSAFLAVIAGLSFVLACVSDPHYRDTFFDPILRRIRVAVAANAVVRNDGR